MSKKTGGQGRGHTGKHVGSHKHHVNRHKHNPHHQVQHHHMHHKVHVHTKGKHGHHARGYAVGDLLPVCTFEALAASLRLAGQRVAEDDLLALWDLAGAREVSIAEALDAAARFGLASVRPAGYAVAGRDSNPHALPLSATAGRPRQQLILGVDRPGPHTVLATPDGWWSWGELWSPWTARIEEAWVISWQ